MRQEDIEREKFTLGQTSRPLYRPAADDPRPDTMWRHYKGGIYRVMHVGLLEANLEPHVVYRIEGHGLDIWIRPLREFKERFRPQ